MPPRRLSKRLQEKRQDVQTTSTKLTEALFSSAPVTNGSLSNEMNNNAEKDSGIIEEVVVPASDNSVYCDGDVVAEQDPKHDKELSKTIIEEVVVRGNSVNCDGDVAHQNPEPKHDEGLSETINNQDPGSLDQCPSVDEADDQQNHNQVSTEAQKGIEDDDESQTTSKGTFDMDDSEQEKLGDKVTEDKTDSAEAVQDDLPDVSDSSDDDDGSEDEDQSSPIKKPPPKATSRKGFLEVDTEQLENRNDEGSDDSNDGNDEGAASLHGNVLTGAQKTERMKTMFSKGIAYHFAGEEMEGCRAIKTELFPHQRVALAWMFRHENKAAEGMLGGILAGNISH